MWTVDRRQSRYRNSIFIVSGRPGTCESEASSSRGETTRAEKFQAVPLHPLNTRQIGESHHLAGYLQVRLEMNTPSTCAACVRCQNLQRRLSTFLALHRCTAIAAQSAQSQESPSTLHVSSCFLKSRSLRSRFSISCERKCRMFYFTNFVPTGSMKHDAVYDARINFLSFLGQTKNTMPLQI